MLIFHRRLPFLGRLIALLGAATFALYWFDIKNPAVLALSGPPIYIAHFAKSLLGGSAPDSQNVKDFGFMLPATLIYYAGLGFLMRQLLNERGALKIVTILALTGFVGFIHYLAWSKLSAYTLPPGGLT